jgi:hypothetical protein
MPLLLAQRIRSRGGCLTQPDIDELVRLGHQLNGFAPTVHTAQAEPPAGTYEVPEGYSEIEFNPMGQGQ